jgi:hypothetical protein
VASLARRRLFCSRRGGAGTCVVAVRSLAVPRWPRSPVLSANELAFFLMLPQGRYPAPVVAPQSARRAGALAHAAP